MTEKKPRKSTKKTQKTPRKSAKSTKNSSGSGFANSESDFSSDPRIMMEQMMRNVAKVLEEQDFESDEEARAFLQDLLNSDTPPIPSNYEETPLERAQNLMYQAWSATGKKRVQLAREALKISEDCADAYVMLAQESAKTLQEAKEFYEKAVQAGERALGAEFFDREAGYFWGITDTRPYMRARQGLGECLWYLGEKQEAIAHYTEMLRLNPNDNQGIRYTLLNCLLEAGDGEAIETLIQQYDDESSTLWAYSYALWLFKKEGASDNAEAALQKALKENEWVPDYLLGKKKMPKQLPGLISMGGESEAVVYMYEAGSAWHKTPGAIDWLSQTIAK